MDFHPRLRGSSTGAVYVGQPKKPQLLQPSKPCHRLLYVQLITCQSTNLQRRPVSTFTKHHLSYSQSLFRYSTKGPPGVPQGAVGGTQVSPASPALQVPVPAPAPLPLPWLSDARQTLSTWNLLSSPALQTSPWVMLLLPQFPQMPFGHY